MANANRKIKYIYDLPYKEERELCTILDLNDKWEELGGKYMEFSVLELYDIKRVEKMGESPTRRLLQLWGQRNNKVSQLYVHLFRMRHYQAMTVIQPFVPQVYHKMVEDTELTRAFEALEESIHSQPTISSYLSSSGPISTRQISTDLHPIRAENYCPGQQAVGPSTCNEPINHNINHIALPSAKSSAIQMHEKAINKVPDSLLQPLRSLQLTPNVADNQRAFLPKGDPVHGCNRQPGKTTSLSGTSCIENNCSNCQKKGSKEHFSKEYRQKALEKFPNLAPSEKIAEARAPSTAQLVSHRSSGAPIQNVSPDPSLPKKSQSSRSTSSGLSDCSVPMIPFEDLNYATDSFSHSNLLGKGGFGSVYKATWKLSKVAVKKINLEAETVVGNVAIGINQSLDELRYLQSFRHKNILQVFGFSAEQGKPTCLVYEFMENGSLEDRLQCKRKFGDNRRTSYVDPLSWQIRLKVALGTASALQYLHTVREKPIIHGDVKSANILLEKDLEAKLGDFGLAREGPKSHYTSVKVSRVNGTRAYIPSEYLRDRKLSTKVDTYSFGVVLFEICSGLRAYDDKRRPQYLKAYVEEATDTKSLIDQKAGGQGKTIFDDLLELGKQCTHDKHNRRPDMVTVYKHIGIIENVFKDQKKRISEEQSTSTMMSAPPLSYIYSPSGFPALSSGSYPGSMAGGPSPTYSTSPRPSYMQYMIRPIQLMPGPYHMPMAPPAMSMAAAPPPMQVLKLPPQRNENVSPSPTTSPSVIEEESAEISAESVASNARLPDEYPANSDFLPLLTDIGKKDSFLD